MKQDIRVTRKPARKGEDNHKVISVRMRDETLHRLEELSRQTNRSRNELINLLLTAALDHVSITEEEK